MSIARPEEDTTMIRSSGIERLLDRSEIEAALVEYCRAVDRIDVAALRRVFHPDAIVRKGGSPMTRDEFVDNVARRHPTVIAATHMVGNVMVDWIARDRAFVQTYCLAVERHPDRAGPATWVDHVYRVRYGDVFERRDGLWRISERQFATDHIMEVPVMPQVEELMSTRVQGERSSDDVIERMRRANLASRAEPAI